MARKTDHKVVNIGPIEITKEFWIRFAYCLLPVEKACQEILAAKDVDAHNQLVTALANMMGALNLDLTGATRPDAEVDQ